MFDFNTGAMRLVSDETRAERFIDAQDLVNRTLAQHGLSALPTQSSPPAVQELGELLQQVLPKGRVDLRKPAPSRLEVPEGAQFLSAAHHGVSGARDYRTYVPASGREEASGIVMMLHGCTQTPEDFAVGTGMNALAEKGRFIVIYPEQSRGANAQTCWNWFSPNDQRRDRGEPEILAGIAQHAMVQYDVPPERTFVAGLSAGAAMAVVLGHTYPEVFAAVGAHSGLPYAAANNVASAFALMAGQRPNESVEVALPSVRTIVFHGAADTTVHPSNGEIIAQNAERSGPAQSLQTEREGDANGRAYTATTSKDTAGRTYLEHWTIDGLGHAWSGGQPGGSYTDQRGPDASAELIRFFFDATN